VKKILNITILTIMLWAISTFIISNQTQKEFQKQINRSNKVYTKNGLQLTLSNYQKSFLESNATIEIDVIDPILSKKLKKDFLFPIKIHYNIEHGPLFFKNNFDFGVSKLNNRLLLSSILRPNVKKRFLEMVKDDIEITSDMVIAFNRELKYNIYSSKIHIDDNKIEYDISPIKINGAVDIRTLKGDAKLYVKKYKYKYKSDNLTLDKLAIDVKIDEILDKNIIFGDFIFSIGNILYTMPKSKFNRVNIGLNGEVINKKLTQKTMSSSFMTNIDLKDTTLPKEYKELKNVHLAIDMIDLGIEGMSQIQQTLKVSQKKQNRLMKELQLTKAKDISHLLLERQKIKEVMMANIIHSLNALLIKDKTYVTYALDMDTKDKSVSSASVELGYTGDMEFKGRVKELTKKVQSQILSLIRMNVDIELDKKHIKLIPANHLSQQLQMGVTQGFVKDNNSSYSLNGYYKDKQLMVNDKNLTATILPLLMMLTAQ